MNRIFLLLLLLPFASTAQVVLLNDDFSDSNFTYNPSWTDLNTDTLFTVNVASELQSNGPCSNGNTTADTVFLSTPALTSLSDSLEWNFLLDLHFNPTVENYARVYLVSDNQNLKGPLNGYYISVFGKNFNDTIKFFRQDGLISTLLFRGITSFSYTSYVSVRIKVIKDCKGNWNIYSDPSGGSNFQAEGSSFADNTYNNSSYFGVYCRYKTDSRFNQFYFDDFSIVKYACGANPVIIVPFRSQWNYFKGVQEGSSPTDAWRYPGFNDSAWINSYAPFYYGETVTGGTLIADMQNNYTSLFFRKEFILSDASAIVSLSANLNYDDGIIIWINGVQTLNSYAPSPPDYNITATSCHEFSPAEAFTLCNPQNYLVDGINEIAVQIFNCTMYSSDIFFDMELSSSYPAIPFSSSNLPIVIIDTYGKGIADEPKTPAYMGIIDNGYGIRNYVTDTFNDYNGYIGIEVRGSSSQMFPKKSYGIELRDSAGNNLDASILGMPSESDWCLIANYSDKTLMRNFLAYNYSRFFGHYASRTRYCEVIINCDYQGVYLMTEKIKRDQARVDIAKLDSNEISGDDLTGGYILKIDKQTGSCGSGWTSNYLTNHGSPIFYRYEYPKCDDIVPEQQSYIQAYVDSFETALNGANFMDTVTGYRNFMKVKSFIDYYILNEISKNIDGYRLSTYFYKDKYSNSGKIQIGPVWDYDLAWWNANYYGGSSPQGWAMDYVGSGDAYQEPFWWKRLLQDSLYTAKLRCRWNCLRSGLLDTANMFNFIDSIAAYIDEGQMRNFQKWKILGQYVWPNPSPLATTYDGEITALKKWIVNRTAWLDDSIPGICNTVITPVISGAARICAGSQTGTYCTDNNMSAYIWIVPPGGTVVSGGSGADDFVNICWNSSGLHTVGITYTEPFTCVIADTSYFNVIVDPAPVVNLGNDTTLCSDQYVEPDAGAGFAGYLWSTGDTLQKIKIDGATAGYGTRQYIVMVTDTAGCTASDTILVTFNSCAGVSEASKPLNVICYPNPAPGFVTIEMPEQLIPENTFACFLNPQNQIVLKQPVNEAKTMIDISALARGIYFVKIQSEKGIVVIKLVRD